MTDRIRLFIPAAGFGERLRPITSLIPKPLLPVLGRPVIERIIERAGALCFEEVGVNAHHMRGEIERWARTSPFSASVRVFTEERILGTGGALKNAETFLSECTFMVHNADVVTDLDLRGLVAHHLSCGNVATLAVHDHVDYNSLCIDRHGFLVSVSARGAQAGERVLAFTGVAVYAPEFLDCLPHGESSVVDAWLRAVGAGLKVGTFDVSGSSWTDIGTPLSYARCVFREMDAEGETLYIDPDSAGCGTAEMRGYVVIERNCALGKGVFLRNCILLPGSAIPAGTRHENAIIGTDFSVELSEMGRIELIGGGQGAWIGTGGSDRKYYRVARGGATAVLMRCRGDDPDYERHLEFTTFFHEKGIPVPRLLGVDRENMSATFQDLGDMSLYSWLKCPRAPGEVAAMYLDVVEVLALLHSVPLEAAAKCPALRSRIFDRDHFRWETSYFLERFVQGLLGMDVVRRASIDEEFCRLAEAADAFSKRVLHRDFQSQNIMIVAGKPHIIDYQGARIGPPAYDLASLLWDPYAPLEESLRSRVVDRYVELMAGREGPVFDPLEFRASLAVCRVQRHMQALGAYGYLATVKGKRYFLKHVPEAVRLLREDATGMERDYPAFCELVYTLMNDGHAPPL